MSAFNNIDIPMLREIIITGTCNRGWFCQQSEFTIDLEFTQTSRTVYDCPLKVKGFCKLRSGLNGFHVQRPSNYRQIAFKLLKEVDPNNAESFLFEELL